MLPTPHSRDRIRILLVSGWAGSGKDAVAAAATGYRRVAFADPLKHHVAAIAGLPVSVFHDRTAKDCPLIRRCPMYPTARTPRDILLQHAAAARSADPDVYAREIAEEIRGSTDVSRWVISDWRYRREYEFLRSALPVSDYEIIRVRVVRPGIIPSTDETEHDLDDAGMDRILRNAGTLEELAAAVATL
jgi:hypothetical protein